jgi:hypothetical protein
MFFFFFFFNSTWGKGEGDKQNKTNYKGGFLPLLILKAKGNESFYKYFQTLSGK